MLTPLLLYYRGSLKHIYSCAAGKMIFLLLLIIAFQAVHAQPPATVVSQKTKDLFKSIRSGSSTELEKQLSNGADANDSLDGYSALMAATLSGTADQMQMLINHGAVVNFIAQTGETALWIAAPDIDKMRVLLDHGADVQHKVQDYGILVKIAAMPGTANAIKMLIDKGADPRNSSPDNLLVYNAATSGDTAILGPLIRQGFNINDSLSFGDHPINGAMWFRTFATLKMLVDNGADVNVPYKGDTSNTFSEATPLMMACIFHDKPALFYLLNKGANTNLKNRKGYTALMLLQQSEKDDPEMTQALLDHGAKADAIAGNGNDALYFALQKGNTGSVKILKKYSNK
jgi:ankyrin repeat protein